MDFVPRVSVCFFAPMQHLTSCAICTWQRTTASCAHARSGVQNERGFWNALSDIWVFNWCASVSQAISHAISRHSLPRMRTLRLHSACLMGCLHRFANIQVSA